MMRLSHRLQICLLLETVLVSLSVDVLRVHRMNAAAELMLGLLFGETALLRAAFEDAKPKSTATLTGAYKLDLPETPTHVRFTADQQSVVVAMPQKGVVILDCNRLGQQV
jgi:hypothetical protein